MFDDFELGRKSKCGLKRGKKCPRIFESKRVEMAGELKLKRVERPLSVQRQRSHHSYNRATFYQLSYKWSSPIGHIVLRCWTSHTFFFYSLSCSSSKIRAPQVGVQVFFAVFLWSTALFLLTVSKAVFRICYIRYRLFAKNGICANT